MAQTLSLIHISLKTDNQTEWVRRMNALRSAVAETVNAEVIFV